MQTLGKDVQRNKVFFSFSDIVSISDKLKPSLTTAGKWGDVGVLVDNN